jgi:uncharacterized membrane protein
MGALLLGIAGLLYPLILFMTRGSISAAVFVAAGLLMIGFHIARLDESASRLWRRPLMVAAVVLATCGLLEPMLAAKFYPVVVSLAAAAAFGGSLLFPPSLIEYFARRQEPDLPPEGQLYCRRVTLIWTLWLSINALIAAVLAVRGMDAAWAAWTGIVSYAVMGTLLIGELVVRRVVRPIPAHK